MRVCSILLSAVLAVLGGGVHAAEVRRCEIPSQKINSFVGGPLVIATEESTGKSVASSPLIMALYGAPIDVKITKNSASVLRATWMIKTSKMPKRTKSLRCATQRLFKRRTGRSAFMPSL
jgi:hypothetical protein